MEILNTNNTTPSLTIPKPVIYFSKALEFISPYLAVRFASVLFTTPIRFKTPQREQFMLKSAQRHQLYMKSIDKKIEVLSYGFSNKKVLLIHGWSGRSTQLYAFADKLLEKGFMVISFDGPAHGKSTGKKTMMPKFLETIKELLKEYGPFESVIGHSFSAHAALNSASDFLKLKSIVSIGSGDKVSEIIKRFANNLNLKQKTGYKLINHLERKWKLNVDDFASNIVAQKINIPVLVIHDTNDGDVPVSSAYHIRQNLKYGDLLITNGFGHTKILRNLTIVNKAVNFIIKNS